MNQKDKLYILQVVASFEFESSYLYTQLLYNIKNLKKYADSKQASPHTKQILQFDISQKSCTIIEYADSCMMKKQ